MNRIRRRLFLLVAVVSAFALLGARSLRADESAAHKEAREAYQKAESNVKEARNNLEDAEGLEKSIPKSAKEEKANAKAAVEKAKKELENAEKDRDKKYRTYMEISRDEARAHADEMRARAQARSEEARAKYLAEQERKRKGEVPPAEAVDPETPVSPSDSQQAETPQTETPPQSPPQPLDKKALEKKIKDAQARAKSAGHNATTANRKAQELSRAGRDSEAELQWKVGAGFLRERGEALNEAAEAKRQLADLKAGRKPRPSTPVVEKEPEPPVEPAPGTPGEPSAGVPETNTKPAPGVPGGEKPATPADPKPADPAGTRLEGSLTVLQDPDTHPHTLCRRLETLPLIARFLLARRVQLALGSTPPLECPMDCEGPDDEFCEGECMGDLTIDGQPLKLRLRLIKPLLRPTTEQEIPALSKLPIVGQLFVHPVGREKDRPLLLLIRPRILIREESPD